MTKRDIDFQALLWAIEAQYPGNAPRDISPERAANKVIGDLVIYHASWSRELEMNEAEAAEKTSEALTEFYARAGGKQRLGSIVAQSNLSLGDFAELMQERIRRDSIVRPAIMAKVDPSLLETEVLSIESAEEASVSIIIFRGDKDGLTARGRAYRVRQEIANGLPFDDAVQLYSEDPVSKLRNGELGWMNKSDINEAFLEALRELKISDVSLPLGMGNTYYLLRLNQLRSLRMQHRQEALRVIRNNLITEALEEIDVMLSPNAPAITLPTKKGSAEALPEFESISSP